MTRAAALLLLSLLSGCPQERGVRFQHVSHAGAGLTCKSCHEGMLEARTLALRHLPPDRQCTGCHADPHRGKAYVGACAKCHGGSPHDPRRSQVDPGHLLFSHERHLRENRGQCFPCHNAVAVRADRHSRLTPGHPQCLTCHQRKWDGMECSYCHTDLTVYALRPVSGFAHAGDFLRIHGRIASSRMALCTQCHTQPYCAACHDPRGAAVVTPAIRWPEAVEKTFIHRGDYVGRHAIEARSSGDSCVRCHARSECTACHDSRGVGQGSERNPHPAGWVSVIGGPNLHGPAARREIVACAGCHDQGAASNCVRCHRVGGVGGNPHPPGWRSRLSKHKDRVCRVCH